MRKRWSVSALALWWGVACASDDDGKRATTGDGGCLAGDEGCPCYRNGTCNDALTCASHLCVRLFDAGGGRAASGGSGGAVGGSAAIGVGGTPIGMAGSSVVGAGGNGRLDDADATTGNDGGSILGTIHRDGGNALPCKGTTSVALPSGLDLYVMMDQSASMSCAIPSTGDRWDLVKAGFVAAFTTQAASSVSVGLQYFGNNGLMSSCSPGDYQMPDVEIAPIATNANALIGSLDARVPTSNTPTPPALIGAIDHAIDWKNAHPGRTTAVVLVTDGGTNACGAQADVVTAAAAGLMSTIPTYVIGIISPNTSCTLDPNPPNGADLNAVAVAGGTKTARIFDVTKDSAKTFAGLFAGLETDSQSPCHYALPSSARPIDPGKVNLEYTPAGAAKPVFVGAVTSPGFCDPASGGWYYDNPNDPTEEILCPATCSAVGTGPVTVELGCATRRGP